MTLRELQIQVITKLLALLQQALEASKGASGAPYKPTMQDTLYGVIQANIGHHCTLDSSVPPEVGCAEAVSFILKGADVSLPAKGIAGTASLLEFALQHFEEISIPEKSALLISATGTGNGKLANGHTGFFGEFGKQFPGYWGIVSNDSQTGLLLEHWSWNKWTQYYTQYGGMRPRIFRIK